MSPATSSRPVRTVVTRLLAIFALISLMCVVIGVILQPVETSAQTINVTLSPTATPATDDDFASGKEISPTATPGLVEATQPPDADKAIQPTPTPQGAPRSVMTSVAEAAANLASSSASDGVPMAYTRGYSDLIASYYAITNFTSLVTSTPYHAPVNFQLWCSGETSPYPSCKLFSEQPSGTNYSVRWTGRLIVPVSGTYTLKLGFVDDEARLFIDGNLVVDGGWNTKCFNGGTDYSGSIVIDSAGAHDIVIEYRQCPAGKASLRVLWAGPDFAEEVIPMANQMPECDCTRHPNCCENEVGGPINTRTGSYDYGQQDISFSALGETLKFKRTYHSRRLGTAALGYGWTHNYNLRLSPTAGGLTSESCDGQSFTYLQTGDNAYQGTPGVSGILTRAGTYGGYTYYLVTANNERYTYNNAGLPIEIADAQGHTTTLTYNGTRLARVADGTGQRYLNFAYDGQGRLIQISDPLGRTVGYGYDAAGDLTVMTDTLGHPWTYTYDGSHRLTEVRNPLNEIVEHTEYDGSGRAVRQWQGNRLVVELQYLDTVDALGLPAPTTVISDAAGGVTTDYYSSRGALVQQTSAVASIGKAYDANYNPTGSTDANGHATSFIYNDQGRPLVITDALGNDTHMQYDAQNHLTRLTDAAGASSYYTYTGNLLTAQSDALGHTTIYTYNPQNLLVAQRDAQGRVTEYEYNAWGQRTAVTTTEGVTHYEYDQVGRLISTTDTFNRVTVNVYDAADHLLRVTRNALAGQPQNYQQAYNLVTSYEYDPAGRQTAITDTLGRVNRNIYDENGQLIKTIVNFDPARAQNELNQYNITTEYGYDVAGHQILVTDTLGHVSRTDYDAQSRPVTVTTNYVDGVYDPARPDEDIRRVTQYDPAGNAIAQIDPLGRVTRTWYDEVNRVISTTTNYDPTRPQNDQGEYNLVTTYGYDQTGNRVLITDTLGRVTRNYYDATGRLISTTANYRPGFAQNYLNQYNLNTFYGYDASGRQVLVTNTLGLANHTAYDPVTGRPLTTTTNYADGIFDPARPDEDVAQSTEYDAHGNAYLRRDAARRATRTWYDTLNRTISVTANYLPGQPQNYLGQYNLVTTYGYDELGNRAWVTDTLGHVTWTQYDALNRAVTVTQNYLPEQPANYLDQYNLITVYEYDALGRQSRMQDARGNATEIEYDGLGRTSAQIDPLEQRTAYAYDVLGNRTVITDAAQHVTRFEYDTLNRLITTTRYLNSNPLREVTRYDAAGNRTKTIDARGQTTAYGYDALGRTIAITDANLHVTTFTYDPLGRRSRMQDARGSGTDYVYDKLGRQIATSDPLGNTTGYGYDVSGNRVVMTDANQIVTRYEYDALDRLSAVIENDTGGAQTNDRDVRTTYAYDALGNRTVMTNARGYATTYEYDALNRLSRMQDARGKITEYAYDVVGNRTVLTDANGEVTLYAYDALNRQTAIDYLADATTVRFAYDAIGNRTAMTDTIGTTQYVFDDLNRLTSVTDPFAQTVGYAYDAAGNRTHVIYPDGKVVTTTYDAAGLLTGVIDWAGQTTTYAYDAANRLITVTLPNTVQTLYTYDDANRLVHLSHTRLSDDTLLADYEFTLDKMGNRLQVIEAMEYPGDSQAAALPPTLADAIVEAITGHRAPGLSAPAITGTLALPDPLAVSRVEPPDAARSLAVLGQSGRRLEVAPSGLTPVVDLRRPDTITPHPEWNPEGTQSKGATLVLAPLAGPGDIFADSFESGNFATWSAAVTNTGRLSVTPAAKRWGNYGMQALITSTTAMYVRDDTPAAEARYRARFYFSPNSITMAANNAHELFVGRNVTGTNVFTVQLSYASSTYRLMAQAVNDSTGISSTAWYPISNTWHFIEIDWQASTSTTARNGYLTLWIDGVQKESKTGIDNDTRRVDEVRLGPLSGIDSGTSGTEYFDAFESRRDTYLGPVAVADFTASPVTGTAPLTVTFTNTSQPTATLTAFLWNFGDGTGASTITNPVHSYLPGYYTVTLTAWNGVYSDTLTKTRLITATVKADFNASPVTGTAPLTVTFNNTSQPANGITSYLWNFGDGVTSTITNPVKTYAPGYYTVTLTAWSGSLKDVITRTRLITAAVKADFTGSPTSGPAPLAVTFSNASQPVNGISSYLWKFGTGATSTLTNPVQTYTSAGVYTVTLTANALSGMKDTLTRTRYITVTPGLGDPLAVASKPFANEEFPRVAYNPSAQEYLVVWREWAGDFDVYARRVLSDGTPTGSPMAVAMGSGDQQAPQVAYGNGVYLAVWEDRNTNMVRGQIIGANGVLSGTAITLGSGGEDNNTPTVDFNPAAGEFLVTWVNYTNGNNDIRAQRVAATGQLAGEAFAVTVQGGHELQPSAAHDASGTYLVVYLCEDSYGFGLCGQRMASDGTLSGSRFTVFDGSSTTSNQPALAYDPIRDSYLVAWRESTGGADDEIWVRPISRDGSTLGAAQALGAQTGEPYGPAVAYRVGNSAYLVVWSDRRADDWDAYARTVDGDGTPLETAFVIEATPDDQAGVTVSKQGAGYELLVAYADNRTGSPDILAERYDASGPNFLTAPRNGVSPLSVVFTDTSTAPQAITNWQWNFGDGVTSTLQHPTHVYSTIGLFTVTLETWAGTLHRTVVKPQHIAVAAQAGFTLDPAQGEAPLVVDFTNTSQPGAAITAYQWDFGDGGASPLTNPVHSYAAYGVYTPSLTAYSAGGANTQTQPAAITVWPHVGDAVPLSSIPAAHEVAPVAVYNPVAQEYLVVWSEWNGENDITARRVLTTGLPAGAPFAIETADGDQQAPAAAYGGGVYLVVWRDDSTHSVRGQIVWANGVLSGTAFTIGGGGEDNHTPVVDYNPVSDEFLAVWVNYTNGENDLRAQRVSPGGQLLGETIALPLALHQLAPALAHDADGNYLVAFLCDEWPDQFAICAQPLSSSGALSGDMVKVYGAPTNSGAPDLAYNPQRDEYLVVWGEDFGGNCDWIYTQRVAPEGSVRGTRGGFSACLDGPYGPHAAYQPLTQQYVVVWTYNGVSNWNAAGRLIEADGTPVGANFYLDYTVPNQTDVTLSRHGPSGDLLVVYADDRTGTADIYGERYRPPLPGFTATPASGPAPLTVVFTDTSTAPYPITSRVWDFGDGGTSSAQQPTHTYAALGTYGVTLTLYTSGGAGRTTRLVTVTTPVRAQFSATPLTSTRLVTVAFSDQSTSSSGALTSWLWEFGDGYTSTQQHPAHFYAQHRAYTVTLTASTGLYSDTLQQPDYIVLGLPHRTVIAYTYDGLHRLTDANYSTGQRFQYAYDPVGNRTAQTATIASTVVTAYQYDEANRLTNVNSQVYTWDDNGNLVSDGAKTYTYNQANRLTSLTQGATTFQFNYNGDGARLRQVIAGVATTYTQDLAAPLPVVLQSQAGVNAMQYVYALGTRPLAHAERGGAWEYLLADGLGSVRQIVDEDGNVTLAESYEPYGSVLSSNGTASSIFAYAGEQVDTSGLVFLRARYMQPTLGIFLARDPWSGDQLRPGSMNGFGYVEGRPINRVDPSGRSPDKLGIAEGRYTYSCNCGWIDWSHAGPGAVASIYKLLTSGESSFPFSRPYEGVPDVFNETGGYIYLSRDVVRQIPAGLTVPSNLPIQAKQVFLGMYEEAEERFEGSFWSALSMEYNVWEGIAGRPEERPEWYEKFGSVGRVARLGGATFFTEEDLPSDLLSFYRFLDNDLRLDDGEPWDNWWGWDSKKKLATVCGFPDNETKAKDWSNQVYDSYPLFADVSLGPITMRVPYYNLTWGNPRLVSTPAICDYCNRMPGPREWPKKLSQNAVFPNFHAKMPGFAIAFYTEADF